MKDTGERHIIHSEILTEAQQYGHFMHTISYEFSEKYIKNKNILDFGCGSGYGTKILAKQAKSAMGIDISAEAINYATKNYSSKNLDFKTIDQLKKEDLKETFDVITSFQVIEHVLNDKEYIETILSLLKPGGLLILTTPNKEYRLFSYIQKPWNIFHIKEYSKKQLERLLDTYFETTTILKISAKKEFVIHEINRLKKQRNITILATLSIYPRFLVLLLLRIQSFLFKKVKFFFKKQKSPVNNSIFKSKYNKGDMIISEEISYATDLLCVCTKKS